MCVSINSVVINFRAKDFTASIQLSRILIQSRTPVWQAGSLKMTRLKDDLRGEVMIFKEAEWQTLRIEANALNTGDPLLATTPLRLIANQSKIRVTIKKRISGSIFWLGIKLGFFSLPWNFWLAGFPPTYYGWRFSAVVASFVARTKLLNVEPG